MSLNITSAFAKLAGAVLLVAVIVQLNEPPLAIMLLVASLVLVIVRSGLRTTTMSSSSSGSVVGLVGVLESFATVPSSSAAKSTHDAASHPAGCVALQRKLDAETGSAYPPSSVPSGVKVVMWIRASARF